MHRPDRSACRSMGLAILITLLATTGVRAKDPVDAFVATADSLLQAGSDDALARHVDSHALLVGAAVAALLDGAPRESSDRFALPERVAQVYFESSGSRVPLDLVERFKAWTTDDLRRRAEARALHDRADAERSTQPALALQLYEKILPVYQSIGDAHSIALLWGGMGVAHWQLGDLTRVREDYERALEARRAVEDRILEGKTLNGLGSVNLQTGNLGDAVRFYTEAIELRTRTGDLVGLGTSLTYLGHAYYKMGRLVDARNRYEQARPVLERVGSPEQMIDLHNGVANCYAEMGRHERANEQYRDAAVLARAVRDERKEARCRLNLADSYQRTGRYAEAMDELQRVEALIATVDDAELPALLYATRGQVEVGIGDLDRARADLLAGVQAAEKLDDPRHLMDALVNIAFLYGELRAVDRGLEMANRAMALARENANMRKYRNAEVVAANLRYMGGDQEAALEGWNRALALDQFDKMTALVLDDKISIASILASLGRCQEAREMFYQLVPQIRTPRAAVSFHLGLAHSFERTAPDSAMYHYEKALSLVESSRESLGADNTRSSFLSGDRRFFFEEVSRYYASQDSGGNGLWSVRAFNTIERAKARGLLDLLAQAELRRTTDSEEELLDRMHTLGEGGGESRERVEIQSEIARIRSERVAASLGRLQTAQPPSIDDVRASLPQGAVMFQYALGDTASLLWTIDRNGHRIHFLPPRPEIELAVQQFRDAIQRPAVADAALRAAARSLFRMLVEPAVARLADAEYMVIVPDGCLHELPFDALLYEDIVADAGWERQPFLAGKWSTVYSPSAAVYVRLAAAGAETYDTDLVAFGNPQYSLLDNAATANLRQLPYAGEEVASIASFVPAGRGEVRLGEEATEAGVRQAFCSTRPRVLHLATHGLVDPVQPERSEVVLCPDPEGAQDGHMRMMEIVAMRGRVGMVVLSACESAMGKVSRGEGVVGLSRAFIAAGAGGTVASLWSVSDESTARLMGVFYRAMFAGHKPAMVALRTARQELIDSGDYSHPFYWSPFIVIGSHRTPW